jgi:Holliday junction resolvase RusA-like endonuclease
MSLSRTQLARLPAEARAEVQRQRAGSSKPSPQASNVPRESVTITLPLPAKCLSPNAKPHRMQLARTKAVHRDRARWATYDALAGKVPRWARATIQAIFYHAQQRVRDQTNLLGSLKAYEDGIVDAGLLLDDEGVTWLPAIKQIDRDNPRVVLTITRTDA